MLKIIEQSWKSHYTKWILPASISIFILSDLKSSFVYIFVLLPALAIWLQERSKLSTIGILWLSYSAFVLLSGLWSSRPELFLDSVRYFIYIFIFLFAMNFYPKEKTFINRLSLSIIIPLLSLEFLFIYNASMESGLSQWINEFPRLIGNIGITNPIYISCIIALFSLAIMSHNNWPPFIYFLIIIGVSVLISPFQTRSAVAGLMLGSILIFIQKENYKIVLGAILAILIVGLGYFLFVSRMTSEPYVRLDIWNSILDQMINNCSLIYGCGLHHEFNINVHGIHYSQNHSLVLSQFFYGGVIGFLSFSFVSIYTLWRLYKDNSPWLSVFATSLFMLFTMRHNLLGNPDITWIMLWMPLGLSGLLFKSVYNARKNHHYDNFEHEA